MADAKDTKAAQPKDSKQGDKPTPTKTPTTMDTEYGRVFIASQGIQTDIPPSKGEHMLQTPWTMYYDVKQPVGTVPGGFDDYTDSLRKLAKFNTVEGFWKTYSSIRPADQTPRGHNLFMFRKSYVPAWESFPKGGSWILKVRKKNGVICRLWEELLFACIGELFEEPDLVGVMLSSRSREDLISVWNMHNDNPEVRFNIGDKLRDILNLDETTKVEYKMFKTSMKDMSTFRNAKTYVYAAQ